MPTGRRWSACVSVASRSARGWGNLNLRPEMLPGLLTDPPHCGCPLRAPVTFSRRRVFCCSYALYGLALFYLECREWLKPLSPLGKFAVIKALVFLTWWQGLLIMILDSFHLIKGTEGWSALDVTKGLQDFAICVEMLFAAIGARAPCVAGGPGLT